MLLRISFLNLALCFLLSGSVKAQDDAPNAPQQDVFVQAYRDYREYLFGFRNSMSSQLESQTVKSFRSQGTVLAYINSANNLIAWYNGAKNDLGDATGTTYELTDHLLIYKRDQTIGVFDKGVTTPLTHFMRDYIAVDGLVAFRESSIDLLKVYYQGQISEVEYTGVGALGGYKAGKNTIGFVNSQGYFKIWHEGKTYEIDNVAPLEYECGKDIVAWINGSTEAFEIFYNGKVFKLSDIKPLSFKVGDGVVAFVTDEGYFKLFSNGKLVKAESYAPDFYMVKDASVLFFIDTKLQLLASGTRFELDQFMPQSYQLSQNCIAWQDPARRLFLFSEGRVQQVTTETFAAYQLNGDILRYDLSDGTSRIYYHGKTF